eukprot:TRINITY_DN23048_c0_g1_i1.p1 TRINITY_DN23048_c0_g1~~TRINITY_DN23048_c0_g1_i1.p1  ORF type:complete len:561 (+),score=189.28 TRINITY_DN23048_c0_g1_i1:70-1752(+)
MIPRAAAAVLLLACSAAVAEACADHAGCDPGVDPTQRPDEATVDYMRRMRAVVKDLFDHGYKGYMTHAYPKDELRALTCTGVETLSHPLGGFRLTLVDSLDALVVFGENEEFCRRAAELARELTFDLDVNVSVFETNIRMLGGLLSAHLLLEEEDIVDCEHAPGDAGFTYDGELLALAYDLGKRLLKAFDTQTGIPYGTVNLRHGVPPKETEVTSLAGGGTYLLEFGVLSVLVEDDRFETAARRATTALYDERSALGLLGNHINITTGRWTLWHAGVGGNTDSFYEYLPKAYALFNDQRYYDMFLDTYSALREHVYMRPWFVEVDMETGDDAWYVSNSLAAFYPGILINAGFELDGLESLAAFHAVFRKYGGLPEGFSLLNAVPKAGQLAYPLRPELAESLWQAYRATRDPQYLRMGADIVYALAKRTRTRCGFAVVEDVTKVGALRDSMESFVLSETLKYLHLLFDDSSFVNTGEWVLNTEGHPFPLREEFARVGERAAEGESVKTPPAAPYSKCAGLAVPSLWTQIGVDGFRVPQAERVETAQYVGKDRWAAELQGEE